jgi:DHA1 family bicyclomycin/chloramphenicol resistance-like MFS transporter
MLWGLGLFFLGSLGCALTPNISFLIVARFFQGAGAGAVGVVGMAAIQDVYQPHEGAKVISRMGVVISLTPALAPIIGGYIDVWFGWRANFIFILLSSVIALALAERLFHETSSFDRSKSFSPLGALLGYSEIMRNKIYLRYVSFFAFLFCGLFAYITVTPFYFIEVLNIAPNVFGYYVAVVVIAYTIGSYYSKVVIENIGMERTILVGIWISSFGSLMQLFVHYYFPQSPLMICFAQMFYVGGMSFVFAPSTALGFSIFQRKRGSVSAVMSTLRIGASSIWVFVGGIIYDFTLYSISLFLIVTCILCFVMYYFISPYKSEKELWS